MLEFITKDNIHEATDVARIRSFMANAERLGEVELVLKCKQRIFELAGGDGNSEIEKRLFQALAAYEEILLEKHGRAVKATYTKRKIRDKGVIATLTDCLAQTDWAGGTAVASYMQTSEMKTMPTSKGTIGRDYPFLQTD